MVDGMGSTDPAEPVGRVASTTMPRVSKLASTAFVMGLLALSSPLLAVIASLPFRLFPPIVMGFLTAWFILFGFLAVLCGVCGLAALKNGKGMLTGKKKAAVGLAIGGIALVLGSLAATIAVPALIRCLAVRDLALCQNNLKQMDYALKGYIHEHKGRFPNLSPVAGNLMCDESMIPEYLGYPGSLVCPDSACPAGALSHPKEYLRDRDYFYVGYCVTSDAEVAAFAEAYREACKDPTAFSDDLKVQPGMGNNRSDTLYHLREGVERPLIMNVNDPAAAAILQSAIPVMIERPVNHTIKEFAYDTYGPGGNVLFLDGHVEFMTYPGKFPMTEATITALESLSASKA
ncbi:MAG TPA: hypothetical protein PKZ01_11800 [Candidatus Hydrogenedentes bacterium]|nr:hypothetical protein [Candidatus Hydrogenedentota bacterium]